MNHKPTLIENFLFHFEKKVSMRQKRFRQKCFQNMKMFEEVFEIYKTINQTCENKLFENTTKRFKLINEYYYKLHLQNKILYACSESEFLYVNFNYA